MLKIRDETEKEVETTITGASVITIFFRRNFVVNCAC